MTLREIGDKLKIEAETVRRRLAKGLRMMRHPSRIRLLQEFATGFKNDSCLEATPTDES